MTLNAEMPKERSATPSNVIDKMKGIGVKNSMGRETFPTIAHAFLDRVKNEPNCPVFYSKNGADYEGITWQEFFENSRDLSLGLLSLGVSASDNICLLSNTCVEWQAVDMAILGAKAATVPIYASTIADDCEYLINHCGAKIIFVQDDKQLEKILSIKNKIPKIEKIIIFSPVASQTLAAQKDVLSLSALRELGKRAADKDVFEKNLNSLNKDTVFTICYTSGTTGSPKGVILTFDSLNSVVEDVEKVMGAHLSSEDILLTFLPFSHVFGKVESMLVYHFGWRVYFAESIEKLFTNIGEVRPTIFFAVPRIFEKAYNKIIAAGEDGSAAKQLIFKWALQVGRAYYQKIWNRVKPSFAETIQYELAKKLVFKKVYAKFGARMRFCIAGGAPLPLEVAQFMQILGITILEGYGLTETCAPVTLNTPDGLKFGTIGKPLPEVAIKVAGDGELLVKSRKVFKGYFKDSQGTNSCLQDGWFHTGDIGVIDSEGFVKITDRKKDLIKTSGGKYIAPQKLENLLKTHKYINQVMVVGETRNYIAVLLILEKDEVIKFAKDNNILFSEYKELVKHEKVRSLVQGLIDLVNKQLSNYETIKRFEILPFEFTVEGGEITPSLKLKRKFCNEKYKSVIEEMYA